MISAGGAVRVRRDGPFGVLDAEVATPLSMVLTEVLQNALEHGFSEPGDARLGTEAAIVMTRAGAPRVGCS